MDTDTAAVDAQYERVSQAFAAAEYISRQLNIFPDMVSRDERDQAFEAMLDVSEWNARHPERKIGPTCPEQPSPSRSS